MCSESPDAVRQQIEKLVLAFCGQAGLFALEGRPGLVRVMAAVSGGADSMALLLVLRALAGPLGIRVEACHVNHGLRGAAADADEAFVRVACAQMNVPLRVFRAGVDGPSPPAHAGEDWARQLRYGFFARLVAEGALVATAHTQNDQAETLLFRLARGAGVHGASAMRARRGDYVRPLLCLTRADTEAYCAAAGQAYVTDETNADERFARNRLRRQALPALCEVNSGAVQNLSRFCDGMARLDDYFSAEAEKLLAAAALRPGTRWWVEPLQAAHPLILEAALYRLVAGCRSADEGLVSLAAAAVRQGSGAVQLLPEVRLLVRGGCLVLERAGEKTAAEPLCAPFAPGEYPLSGGRRLVIGLFSAKDFENTPLVHKKDLKNRVDYDRIIAFSAAAGAPALLRTRQAGDRFAPAGRNGSKSLKKLLNEQGVPVTERAGLPLVAVGGQVLWLAGQGASREAAPNEETRRLVVFTIQEGEHDGNAR